MAIAAAYSSRPKKQPEPSYTSHMKRSVSRAIKHYLKQGGSCNQMAQALGCNIKTVYAMRDSDRGYNIDFVGPVAVFLGYIDDIHMLRTFAYNGKNKEKLKKQLEEFESKA